MPGGGFNNLNMTQTITIAKNQDLNLRIPWKVLKKADFPVGEFKLSIKKPAIFIVPQQEEEKKDWFDEALETAEGKAYFKQRVKEAQKEYQEGKTRPIEELFLELGV